MDTQNPWIKYIDKRLLKALIIKNHSSFQKNTLSKWAFLFWAMGVLALSGPAWDKMPVPATQTKTNTVIIMDLNKNLSPKELQQIHIQFYDLLSFLKDNRVGLVVYGTTKGYTAMPLTPDIKLIENLIPSLLPSILPEEATNPKAGIQEAEKMLNQTGGNGRIIFMGKENRLSSKYPLIYLNQQDNLNKIGPLLLKKNTHLDSSDEWNQNADVWYDRGIWLTLLCLIPAALLFRKNIIFLLLIVLFSINSQAELFRRADQKDYALNQQGIQAFINKEYQKAENLFDQSKSPYNKGNTLAFQGKIKEAIQSYEEALKINPEDKDAQFNKEYLEKQIPPEEEQQKQENQSGQQQQQSESQSEESSQQNQNNEKQDAQENDQPDSTKEENQSDSSQSKESENQPTQDETQKELEQALAEQETEDHFNQEEQQILNRLNRDPARVLRYRINLQHYKG